MRLLSGLLAALAALFASPVSAQIVEAPAGRPAPPSPTDKSNVWLLDLSTGGRVSILLRPDVAPKMVERIKTLTRRGFYDGLTFHRVIDGFMAQGGDPKGDGTGGSELPDVEAEFNHLPHVRGAVAAARAQDKNSANSQFYIIFFPRFQLDKDYTVFGRVLDGMQHVDAIERGEPPANPSRILKAYIASDNPPAYVPPPVAAPANDLGPPVTLPGATSAAAPSPRAKPSPAPTRAAPPRRATGGRR